MPSVLDTIRFTPDQQKQASEYINSEVFERVFLEKMASLGFPARTRDEAVTLLQLDADLRQAEAKPQPTTNRYKNAAAGIRKQRGLPDTSAAQVSAAEEDEAIKIAAVLAEQNEDLYYAMIGLKLEDERRAGRRQ